MQYATATRLAGRWLHLLSHQRGARHAAPDLLVALDNVRCHGMALGSGVPLFLKFVGRGDPLLTELEPKAGQAPQFHANKGSSNGGHVNIYFERNRIRFQCIPTHFETGRKNSEHFEKHVFV